jgi:hypothetical protein
MKRSGLVFLKLSVAALIAAGLSERSASAQSMTAAFTIPYEVSWGGTMLPAGDYTITFESAQRPLLVRSLSGEGRALVLPVTVNRAISDQPTALILARSGKGHDVRTLNLREANVALGYGVSRPERKVAVRIDESATLADLSAK